LAATILLDLTSNGFELLYLIWSSEGEVFKLRTVLIDVTLVIGFAGLGIKLRGPFSNRL
jgi:hypothetical protein